MVSSHDLSAEEIERRFAVALRDIRRGGTGDIARAGARRPSRCRSTTVLDALRQGEATIAELASRVNRDYITVWGHVCFLRKCLKVEVKAYIRSAKNRRIAVYGVKV